MLSELLSKSTCAQCRFCCSFRRCSLWETPLFDIESVKILSKKGYKFDCTDDYGKIILEDKYLTDNPEEEAPCYFLDNQKGCILTDDLKPFDCKIWPFRLMDKNGQLVVALTPSCPAINKYSLDTLKDFLNKGTGEKIYNYGKKHPFIIKEYRENFPVLWKSEE